MKRVCVLIRVYNRVEDLQYCINIIRDTWKRHHYFILVAFNGEEAGYAIPEETLPKIDLLLTINNNPGHFSGNSQLLLEGLPHIPEDCDYTLILEADTWLYGDGLIEKYIHQLRRENAVWASAQFFRYVLNLATDFALVDTAFVKTHLEVFRFKETPEYYIANFLTDNGFKFIYIHENMPVNLPRYVKRYPFAPTGRFFLFPKAKMVTHHIEALKNGMTEKQSDFNAVAQTRYFDIDARTSPGWTRFGLRLSMALSTLLPYSGWIIKRKKRKA
jgi:hypothetical protein